MIEAQDRFARRIARYGIPAVIVVFYCTAAIGFSYTPDSTFRGIEQVRDVWALASGHLTQTGPAVKSVSPLWAFLLWIGSLFNPDLLLVAKILSLLFVSLSILTAYLVAVEILRDRVLAFFAALMLAVQSWLPQLADSGHPLALALLLLLGCLFFLLRNEYVLGGLVVGLCFLVFREAAALLLLLVTDAVVNSVDRRRGWRIAAGAVAVAAAAVLPWLVFAVLRGGALIPSLPSFTEFPGLTRPAMLVLAVTGGLGLAGFVLLYNAGENRSAVLRALLLPFLCLGWLLGTTYLGVQGLWRTAIPLALTMALLGLSLLLRAWRGQRLIYLAAIVLAGIVLLQNQLDYNALTRPRMNDAITRSSQLVSIAYWLRSHAPTDACVLAEQPGILSYYSGRPVLPRYARSDRPADYVVSSERILFGYKPVYGGAGIDSGATMSPGTYAVWMKENP